MLKLLELLVESWLLLLSFQRFTSLYILVSIRRSTNDEDAGCRCRFILYTTVWLVSASIFVVFLGVNVGVPAVREVVFRTVTDTIQFVMYCITMVLIMITGVIIAFGIEDS